MYYQQSQVICQSNIPGGLPDRAGPLLMKRDGFWRCSPLQKESLLTIVTGVHGGGPTLLNTAWRNLASGPEHYLRDPLGSHGPMIKSRRQGFRFRDSHGSRPPA